MSKVTPEQISEAFQFIAMVGGVVSPANAASLALLATAAARLNALVVAIKNQNDADSAAVWKATVADYKDAVSSWEASIGK